MYNRTEKRWLKGTYSAVGKRKVLFGRNVKSGMFGLGMVPKEIFLAYSIQFVFSTIRLTWLWSPFTYAEKAPSGRSRYIEFFENVYFSIFVLFIVDTISILKLALLTV